MTPNFEVVVGTYEQFLLGYKINKIINEYKMEQTFATHSHLASIRTVASNKHYLASGGADETVCLYDMRYRSENGKLMHHNDSVNCITFTPDASHILTGSSDGSIGVVRCGNWQLEKIWQKPHKGLSIEALAVHPTGKIALSTGGDGVLKTWNLVKGKLAYATNLVPRWKSFAKNISILKWSPNGEKYLIASNKKLDVYSVETAGVAEEIELESKIICVEFLSDDLIAIGFEDGKIAFYDLDESVQTLEIVAHDIRLKCMQHFDDLLVTASSSGEIKLWRFTKDSLTLLNRVTCNSRILCLTLASKCNDLKFKKEDIEVEEEIAQVKKLSKMRMRQEVIIEDEGEEPATIKTTKKKSKRLKESEETENIPINKKKKLSTFTMQDLKTIHENRAVKRSSDDEVEVEIPIEKKKSKHKDQCIKAVISSSKKKESAWTEEQVNTPVIKMEKKNKILEKQINKTQKTNLKRKNKRKLPLKDIPSLPKKNKTMDLPAENVKKFSKKKKNRNKT